MYRAAFAFGQVTALLTVLLFGLPMPSEAEVFWTDDFENLLTPNWDTSACGVPAPPAGCNGFISTDIARSGTRSLQSHYPDINVQAGTFYDRRHTATDQIWVRFYYFTQNFLFYPLAATKHLISVPTGPGGSQLYLENLFGSREIAFNATTHPAIPCPNGTSDESCNYYPNIASVPLADNKWYCIEYHAIANTPGQANATLEIFIDGVQTLGYYNRVIRQTSDSWFILRHYTQYGQGNRYIDDLAVGNTRIGCSGSPTPPTVPTGVTLR